MTPSMQACLAQSQEPITSPAVLHQVFRAEESIAQMGDGDLAELHRRLEATPRNGYLKLWQGLVLEARGESQAACEAYGQAIHLGCDHWRLGWYIARAARRLGRLDIVDQACTAVLKASPQFWYARELPKHARGYYAQLDQDQLIEGFFKQQPPRHRVFVEVGAFDGVHYSNVRRLQERYGWTGLCIEPVEKNFKKLVSSYQGSSVKCVRAAVTATDGDVELNVSTYPHLPDWGSDVASLSAEGTDRWSREYGAQWTKEKVPGRTLTTLLSEASIQQFDLLSVDAEGHDLEVLESLDFTRFAPQLIIVEYGDQREPIARFLAAQGYSLLQDNGQDLLAGRLQHLPMAGVSLPHTRNFTGLSGKPGYEEIQLEMEQRLAQWLNKSPGQVERIVVVGGYCGHEIRSFLQNYPRAEIHVFEPSRRYFPKLQAAYGGEPRVKTYRMAVGDRSGTSTFHEGSLEGVGSLLPLKTRPDAQTWIPENFRPEESYPVAVTSLDDFEALHGKSIDLLWCDVQGAELQVLKGAQETLKRTGALFLEVATTMLSYEGQCRLGELNRCCFASGFYLAGIGLCPTGNGTGNALWLRAPISQSASPHGADTWHAKVNPHLLNIGYLPREAAPAVKRVPATDLITPQRFDLPAKTLYARHLLLGVQSDWATRLYHDHIRALSGQDCREGDNSKHGIDDYLKSFRTLLEGIGQNGFDPNRTLVPVGSGNVIIDGAHRVAACVVSQCEVGVLAFERKANVYDAPWFRSRGLAMKWCDALALEYCRLRPDTYIVMVYPAAQGRHEEIQSILRDLGQIVYEKSVPLNRQGAYNLVRQVYAGEKWLGDWTNGYAGAWGKANPCFAQPGPLRVFLFQAGHLEKVVAAKKRIRDLFGIENHSVHINDTHEQTLQLARLFFNDNSIHFLNFAQPKFFEKFEQQMRSYQAWLKQKGCDSELFCIDGSAVMAAYGIRESADLDVLHFGEADFSTVEPQVNSHNSEVHHHVVGRDDILFNPDYHFYFCGLKFASLEVIRRLKAKRNEPKDRTDVAAIDALLAKTTAMHAGDQASCQKAHRPGVSATGAKIVALLPARNEAAHLPFCLRALACYADAIVYLDDASDDDSLAVVKALAAECRVERLLTKAQWHRDEPGDRNALLKAGREIGGTHFIVLDADEAFTANCRDNDFLRRQILALAPGGQLVLHWIQLWRGVEHYRFDGSVWTWNQKSFAFCDDGQCSYRSEFIHTSRVPEELRGPRSQVPGYERGVLHFQFTNWRNLLVKQAWYRCLEHLRDPQKPAAAINERYAPSKEERGLGLKRSPKDWLAGYSFFNPALLAVPDRWRETQVLGWFRQYGRHHFKELDIWDVPWGLTDEPLPASPEFLAAVAQVEKEAVSQGGPAQAGPQPPGARTGFGGKGAHSVQGPHLPAGAHAALVQAQAHLNRGELIPGADCLEQALAQAPDSVELLFALGGLRLHLGDVEAAHRALAKASGLQPNNPSLQVKRAAAAVQLGRVEEFEEALGRALQLEPENLDALRLLTDLNLREGHYLDGAQTCMRILKVVPQDIPVMLALGKCLFALGELATARDTYTRILQLEPANQTAVENLAVLNRKMQPLLSAIVSTYKSERFIRGCLEDLVGQTLFQRGQLEIIVVDSCSPENERAIVEQFQQRHKEIVYIRTEERETIYAAWNRGIQAARGKYVTNANTDDRHRPDALEVMAAFLEQHPEVALVYADQLISEAPNETFAEAQARFRWNWPEYSYAELERQCIIGPQPVWRRNLHEKYGLFDGKLHSAGDYEFWLRIGNKETIRRLPDILGVYYRNLQGDELSGGHSRGETQKLKADYGILARGIQPAQTLPVPISPEELERLPFRNKGARQQPARQRPRISVVMPCYDRPEALQRCLESLARQTLPSDQFEVICVDDGSPNPAIAPIVQRAFQSMRGKYHRHPTNRGRAHARNSGLRLAQGEFILFMDSDIVAEPGLLAEHLKVHEARRGQKVCVLSHIAAPPAQLQRSALARALEESNLVLDYAALKGGRAATYMHFYTGNISISRQAFESVGGFDEDFKSYGVEDTEYGWRLQQAGYRIIYCPQARCEHWAPDPTVESFTKRQHAVALNFTRLFRSHPQSLDDACWGALKAFTRQQLEPRVAGRQAQAQQAAAQAQALLDALASEPASYSRRLPALLPLLRLLHDFHWHAGLLEGLRREGVEGFADFARPAAAPELLLSVIIPTYNRSRVLRQCLEALARQTVPASRFEVLVSDDGSTDDTPAQMAAYAAPYALRYLRQENRGPAAARNRAIEQARGHYLLFLNDDAVLEPDALALHLAAHQGHPQEKIAVLGRFAFPPDFTATPFGRALEHSTLLFNYPNMKAGQKYNFNCFYTCNISLARQAVVEAGLFDEAFTGPAAEDIELGYRLFQRGYWVVYEPKCVAWHHHDMTPAGFCRTHRVRGEAAVTLMLRQPEVPWYPGFEFSKLRPQLEKLQRELPPVKRMVALLEQVNQEKPATPQALADKTAQITSVLQFLQQYHELEGMLASPRLLELAEVRKQRTAQRAVQRAQASGAAPLVSVVVTCYNYGRFLTEAVESVVAQTFKDFELIIVDDGSTDNTPQVVQQLVAKHQQACSLFTLRTQNTGQPAAARNIGIAAAHGRYVLCLDADDKIAETYLEKAVAILEQHPEVGVAYSHIQHFGELQTVYPCGQFELATLARDNVLPYCALYRRDIWERVGGYRLNIRGYEDWDFWLSVCEQGWKGHLITEPLFFYRKHGAGLLADSTSRRETLLATLAVNHPGVYGQQVAAEKARFLQTKGTRPFLRITYLISSIQGVTGGNQSLLRQAEYLRRRGHEVTIVTYTPKPAWFQWPLRVIQVPAGKALAGSVPPSDVVVATYFTNAHELPAITAPVKIYYAQGDQFVFGDATIADTPQNRRFRELSQASYRLPGVRFVPNSVNLAQAVEQLCGRRPDALLPVCTDQTVFRPLQRSLSGARPRVLIVGPDARGTATEPLLFKGIQDTYEALELLAKRYPHFSVVRMSGTPPDIFAKFPCEFHRAPDDATKTALFGTADVLIYASHYDSCPRPPQEAMAAGCAVVCTATGGAREYCQDEVNSLLVPIQSPAALADAVERLLKDPALRERLVRGGLATAREFPREREWTEWEAMLYRFVGEAASSPAPKPITTLTTPKPAKPSAPAPGATLKLPACALVGHLSKARELLRQKKLSAAWDATRAALQTRPFHPEAYLLLAEIALAAGDGASARRCAQYAHELAPSWKPARKFLKGKLAGHAKPAWLVLPDTLSAPHASRLTHQVPRLSVCLIARNEEQFLAQCLASVRGLADQIVVVDTGSADRTVEIAKEHGAEVHHFAWCDDFSAARNAALEHATGDWVLVLDADEELPATSHEPLRRLLRDSAVMAWRLPIIDVSREDEGCAYVPRLFRNAPGLFFISRVHEEIFSSVEMRRQEWGLDNRLGDAPVRHHGYRPEVIKDRNKIERNLRLLEKAIQELPGKPALLMNYGLELTRSGQAEAGLEQYRQAFALMSAQPAAQVVPETREMLLCQLCTQLLAQKRFEEIVRVLTSPLAKAGGLSASLHFMLGLACMEQKQFAEAAAEMRHCLAKRGQPSLAPINKVIRTVGPRHCLALCLNHLDQAPEAAQAFREAIQEDPAFRAARLDYARFLAAHEQPVEALNLLFALTNEQPNDTAVWLFGGQIALSRPEFLEVALDWTAQALAQAPSDPAILEQRAQALTLAGQCEAALALWRQLPAAESPAVAGPLVLCETVRDENRFRPLPQFEALVSREFLTWYKRLVDFGQRSAIEAINKRAEVLEAVLPAAGRLIAAVAAQTATATPVACVATPVRALESAG